MATIVITHAKFIVIASTPVLDFLFVFAAEEIGELVFCSPEPGAQIAGPYVSIKERKVLTLGKSYPFVLIQIGQIVDVYPSFIHLHDYLLFANPSARTFDFGERLRATLLKINMPFLFNLIPIGIQLELYPGSCMVGGIVLEGKEGHGVQGHTLLIVRDIKSMDRGIVDTARSRTLAIFYPSRFLGVLVCFRGLCGLCSPGFGALRGLSSRRPSTARYGFILCIGLLSRSTAR